MPLMTTEREGRTMLVRLDNPPRNFMNAQMVDELDALTRELEADSSVGAVVITGAMEGTFITHFDVGELVAGGEAVGQSVSPALASGALRVAGVAARLPGAPAALARTQAAGLLELRQIHDVFMRMNRMDKVFVAAVNGIALGGGCELALACDIRLMADGEQNRIGLPEMTLGLIPGAGGTQRMARALGPARALELILEGRALSPSEAAAAGLVHRTVAPERLLSEARAVADRLSRRSPLTVAAAKRAVYEGGSRSLAEGMHTERAGFLAAVSSPAALRAMSEYRDRVAALPDGGSPWSSGDFLRPWQDGDAVNMISG